MFWGQRLLSKILLPQRDGSETTVKSCWNPWWHHGLNMVTYNSRTRICHFAAECRVIRHGVIIGVRIHYQVAAHHDQSTSLDNLIHIGFTAFLLEEWMRGWGLCAFNMAFPHLLVLKVPCLCWRHGPSLIHICYQITSISIPKKVYSILC